MVESVGLFQQIVFFFLVPTALFHLAKLSKDMGIMNDDDFGGDFDDDSDDEDPDNPKEHKASYFSVYSFQ